MTEELEAKIIKKVADYKFDFPHMMNIVDFIINYTNLSDKKINFFLISNKNIALAFIYRKAISYAYTIGIPNVYITKCKKSKETYKKHIKYNMNHSINQARYEMEKNYEELLIAISQTYKILNTRKNKIHKILENKN